MSRKNKIVNCKIAPKPYFKEFRTCSQKPFVTSLLMNEDLMTKSDSGNLAIPFFRRIAFVRLLKNCSFPYFKRCVLLFIILFLLNSAYSQDLEKLPDSLYFKASGGINLGLQAYTSSGMNARRDPFSYLLNANLVINISDAISMPFSATLSSGSKTYNTPKYNIVGISPKYKAVTVHAGYRNMQFSQYTLSGISFFGLGVEVAPKESFWKFKTLGGRFAKGIPFKDDIKGQVEMPSFARWGWGGMLTLGTEDYSGDIILFKATDNHSSITVPDTANLTPKENLTFGINTRFKLVSKLKLTAEYAGSAFTEDIRMEEIVYDRYTYLNNLGRLYTPRLSSTFSNAYSLSLSWSAEKYAFGASFQRVDPDYQTLGSTYISNDFRNITINFSKSFLENKISISSNYGVQKNNLSGDREQTESRVIGAFQGTYNINEKLNFSVNYANYSTSSSPSYIEFVDSVKYMQVSENYGGMVSFSEAGESVSHNIMANLAIQKSDMLNNTATEITQNNTLCKNLVVSYTLSFQPVNISFNTSMNATVFEMQGANSTNIGPVFSIQKPFLDRNLNTSLSYSYMNSKTGELNNTTSVARLNLSYKLYKKHTLKFSASANSMGRMEQVENTQDYVKKKSQELRFVLNYSWNF